MKYVLSFNAQNSIPVLHLKELDIKMFKEKVKTFTEPLSVSRNNGINLRNLLYLI